MKAKANGIHLRDWFAGQALAGLGSSLGVGGAFETLAIDCYKIADTMLAAGGHVVVNRPECSECAGSGFIYGHQCDGLSERDCAENCPGQRPCPKCRDEEAVHGS